MIGTRSVRGDGKSRKFVENVVCFLLRMIFGVKVSDANAPYRLMKTDLVAKYIGKLQRISTPQHHVHHILCPLQRKSKVHRHHLQTPTRRNQFHQREKIVKIGWKAVKDFYKLKKEL